MASSSSTENKNQGNMLINFPFSPPLPACSIFDMIPPSQSDNNQKASSFVGYIDELSHHDFTTSSSTLFDWFPTIDADVDMSASSASATTQLNLQLPPLPLPVPSPAAVSEVLNNPATPVSFSPSISSSSNEAGVSNKSIVAVAENEDEPELEFEEDGDDGIRIVEKRNDQDQKAKKPVKPRKRKSRKNQRPPRVIFETKTDVDIQDDGFRWRKYGQKPVKNSPYPRSYFRCTAIDCQVKKRIERSATQPSKVLTSYEGQHNHLCPIMMPAANFGIMPKLSGFQEQVLQHHNITSGFGNNSLENQLLTSRSQQFQRLQDDLNRNVLQQQQAVPSLLFNNNNYNNSFNTAPTLNAVNSADNFLNSSTSFGGLLQNQVNYGGDNMVRNNGLLQDMVAPMEIGGARAGVGEGM